MQVQTERVERSLQVVAIPPAALEEIPEVDRVLVQNVIYAILACKHPERLCTSWSATCTPTHHIVTAMLPEGDFDVSLVDLEIIQSLSPLRITCVCVMSVDNKMKLVVKILNHKQRVQLTEGELVITQKKRRLWS